MINSIGFKNFRRFTNFPEIDLGDITILVGGNNAGKSTLVKAMLLMRDFLNSRIERVEDTKNIFKTFTRPQFSFDTEHANIGDFYRAFCRQSPRNEDTISFSMTIDKFNFTVNVRGERRSGFIPEVTMIAVSNENRGVTFTFDFVKSQMTALFGYDSETPNNDLTENNSVEQRIKDLNEALSKSKDLDEISKIKLELEQLERRAHLLSLRDVFAQSSEMRVTIDMSYFTGNNVGKMVIPELIKGFAHYSGIGTLGDKRSKEYKEQEASKNFLKGKESLILAMSEEVEKAINSQTIEYIYAHSVNHSSLYAECANSSDYTKRTIHEFYNAHISSGDIKHSIPKDEEFKMIEEWLGYFGIGKSLKVLPLNGDNYRVVIFDDENPEITGEKRKGYPGGIDLTDKGMGSIQLVILLLRLATLIRKYKGQQLTILLEEPEQNLHPALQSKLADLVNTVNKDFRVRFIIETHSEYLIRKTQVLVAAANKSIDHVEIPFKVIYLPDNGKPYDMSYRTDGKFSNEFGPGFFDTAANLAFELF